jgi:hypothetical protein
MSLKAVSQLTADNAILIIIESKQFKKEGFPRHEKLIINNCEIP